MITLTTTHGECVATALDSVDACEYSDWLIQDVSMNVGGCVCMMMHYLFYLSDQADNVHAKINVVVVVSKRHIPG